MTGTLWIPGAERLTPVGASGTMLGGPARVVWHTTEAPSGGRYFDVMRAVLTEKAAEPHLLWDPLTDRLGQFFPLDRSSRALKNDAASGTSTNRTGTACIQIEVVGYAATPVTRYWQPGPNYRALMAAIRSWGIPDAWPGGRLSATGDDAVSRSLSTWKNQGGHYGHCQVPGNSHWDPGAIDQQATFRAAEEDDVPLTDAEIEKIAQRTRQVVADGTVAYGLDSLRRKLDQLTGEIGFIHEIPARANTYVSQSVAAMVKGLDVDEAALAASLAPLLAPLVVAALGEAKGCTPEEIEAAVRRVFADASA